MATSSKPLVLPETYTGEGEWSQWICHFENVAAVNDWDDDKKLLWLKVRLTGRAQKAFQRLSDTASASYKEAKKALKERFEPASRKGLYQAEFQTRRKRKTEGWAEFAEDLKIIVDKAYPDLQDEAREQMALTHYLSQIDNPQVAFAVKQQKPDNLDSAVSTTLEMESYLVSKSTTLSNTVAVVESEATHTTDEGAEAVGAVNTATGLMKELLERMEKLETEVSAAKERTGPKPRGLQQRRQGGNGRRSDITCWSCGGPGHFARDCQKTGNGRPLA